MTKLKTQVSIALEKGVRWLRSQQQNDGTWSDFNIGIWGSSDDWVTAYICCALRAIETELARELRFAAAQALLARQRPNGGWGYNRRIPSDADSTSFSIRAILDNLSNFDQRSACAFLLMHQDVNGGFKTYSSPHDLQNLSQQSGREVRSFAGWCSTHVEVTASVIESLDRVRMDELTPLLSARIFLERYQHADGLWRGYWATDTYYPTYRSVVALRPNRSIASVPLDNTREALRAKQHRDGSWQSVASTLGCSFRTALAAESLLLIGESTEATLAATRWLLGQQQPDGRWTSKAAFLRVPPPHIVSPDEYHDWGSNGSGRGAYFVDIQGIFTTGTVLSYLSRYTQELMRL